MSPAGAPMPRRRRAWALATLLGLAFIGFMALGAWQLQRMAWKHALIERVDARVHAAPVPPPPRAEWVGVTAERDGYRRVRVEGRYLPGLEVRTQAVTALGGGAWTLAPLQLPSGGIVLVNRGFVPTGGEAAPPPGGTVAVEGLLRISEPGGGFLRRNAPAEGRWHSRDVAAIAASLDLAAADVAPYFIDADADPSASGWPRGGLTVVSFRDSHLVYALTWFGLAALSLLALARLFALERRVGQDAWPGSPDPDHARTPGRH